MKFNELDMFELALDVDKWILNYQKKQDTISRYKEILHLKKLLDFNLETQYVKMIQDIYK